MQRVSALVQDSEFWSSTRFLVNTGRQLASYKHGERSTSLSVGAYGLQDNNLVISMQCYR